MTRTLGTNSDNDIYLGADDNIVMLSGIEAVLGACATISKSQLGEMILATKAGIPNFEAIWVGVPNYAIWEQYLRAALENVDGVVQVTALELSVLRNTLSYTATIKTKYGTGTLNG